MLSGTQAGSWPCRRPRALRLHQWHLCPDLSGWEPRRVCPLGGSSWWAHHVGVTSLCWNSWQPRSGPPASRRRPASGEQQGYGFVFQGLLR